MIRLFLKFELGKIVKYFSNKTLAKIITSLLFLSVFTFVGIGIYYFFLSGFRYINFESELDSKLALALFLYEIFLLVLAVITVFSALVSGIFNLYKGSYNNWIIGSPSYTVFPKVVFLKSLLTSALPFLVMFVPAILAFNRVYGLGGLSLTALIISVILFLVIINSLTLSLLLLVTHLYYLVTKKVKGLYFGLKGLIGVMVTLVAIFIGTLFGLSKSVDLVQLFKADIESEVLSVANIAGYFNFLPTHPFAMEILSWQNNDASAALSYLSLLFMLAVFALLLWWKFSPSFYTLWQRFQEGSSAPLSSEGQGTKQNLFTYHFNGSQTAILFKKELLTTSRNFKGILWFLFLFVIWMLQIGTNTVLGFNIGRHQPDVTLKIAILQSLQFIIAIYFISSFSLRFVFPSFSVERKTSWILGSAPLSFRKIFFGKYFFYITFFTILGAIMSYANVNAINISLLYASYTVISFVIATIFIVTLGLCFGAIFPSGESDDPEVITTSMPGLFFTAFSLSYGAIVAWALYLTLSTSHLTPLIVVMSLSLVTIVLLLLQTSRFARNPIVGNN